MYRQALDKSSAGYSGFNSFIHERALAGPGYAAFKVPNSDRLYSTAWLDLTHGPIEVTVQDAVRLLPRGDLATVGGSTGVPPAPGSGRATTSACWITFCAPTGICPARMRW